MSTYTGVLVRFLLSVARNKASRFYTNLYPDAGGGGRGVKLILRGILGSAYEGIFTPFFVDTYLMLMLKVS
jgi:hypothetical protein